VALEAGWLGPQAADWLHTVARSGPRAKLAFHLDPVGLFAEQGASPGPLETHLALAARTAARHAPTYTDATFFLASGRAAHEAGAGEALELGVMAASVVAYLRAMTDAGLAAAEALARIVVGLSANEDYFTTLAKHRGARAIWARLTAAYGAATPIRIEARASRRMLSRLDPWVNLLRLTAAGFAAATGGADAIVLEPFTQPIGRASAFARRQARNTQLVLMEESDLARVEDPAGGGWFLEDQTDQLARAGWAVLQEIERRGGIVAALQEGYVATAAAEARARRARDIATRKAGLVGVSAFPNLAEAGVETLCVDSAPFARKAADVRQPGEDSACPPLSPWRAAEPFEHLRQQAARAVERPKAYLATLGADHAARTGFVSSLLASGGMLAETGEAGEYTPADGAVAVLCGSDADYAGQAVATAAALKAKGVRLLYLAGRPGELEAPLRAAGVDGFLFMGADAVADLDALLTAALGGEDKA
jgi:methylmalonyl-CoA mutase